MKALDDNRCKEIGLLTTGGTIDRTYDPMRGVLRNDVSVLDLMLEGMELEGVRLHRVEVLNMDSLDMAEEDHQAIVQAVTEQSVTMDGIIIIHGTDRLTTTGDAILEAFGDRLQIPVVLTGAMRPWIMRNSDAPQNLTESLLAVQLLSAGVYVCMHNRVLRFPGVEKDREQLRFVYTQTHFSE